ncbi:MAG: hypothetical protein HOB82_10580 [Alphaproteobacteria bacterium]|nr:hypothetical protein [Alphaproteobacteria bacterium]MBT5859722.1 hypothetical protein [Alphaproteobacteria bacterium]
MRLVKLNIGWVAAIGAIGATALLIGGLLAPAQAQNFGVGVLGELVTEDYERGEVRDLRIGMHHTEILPQFYFEHACGSNGGPPFNPVNGFADYMECPAEAGTGLHEIYVRYDDENEFVVRLYRELEGQALWLETFTGTKVAGHPVILSVLFDEPGTVQGIRVVSDPRAGLDQRRYAYLMRIPIMARYGRSGWECEDLEATQGETEVGGMFVKQRCSKVVDDEKRINVDTNLFRKRGQDGLDDLGNFKAGDFESSARFEIFGLDVPDL